MSMFKKMFGKKKSKKVSTASESIQKLLETENLLLRKREMLEEQIAEEQENAKKNATTNKRSKKFPSLFKYLKLILLLYFQLHFKLSSVKSVMSNNLINF